MFFLFLHPFASTSITVIYLLCINPCKLLAFHQHGSSELLLADLGIGDWFGGLLFSAGQQANEAVQDQLSALSFSRYVPFHLC